MKKILIYRWNSYNDLDIEQTFRRLGYEVDSVERREKTYDRDLEFERILTEKITQNVYEFFFTMNYFPAISNLCERMKLRYVCWTCDNPLIGMYDRYFMTAIRSLPLTGAIIWNLRQEVCAISIICRLQ